MEDSVATGHHKQPTGLASYHKSAQRKQNTKQGLQGHDTILYPVFTLVNKKHTLNC